MKYIKSYILLVLAVFALTGCNQYDDLKDDVNGLKDRVTLIEQQVTLLNDNLEVIGYILDTQHKTISKVEKSADGTQHVITLSNDQKLTLTIGKPGTIKEPVITVGDDKMWYVNGISTGVIAVGQDGKNGDGFPEFRVENGKWQVRFGSGLWGDVAGSQGIVSGSLGDQFFESAKVEGNQFVVTMKQKDGEVAQVYNFPVVDALTCSINANGHELNKWNYYEFNPNVAGYERKIFLVKVEGENPQVSYPQNWRAELKKLETPDAAGNNYQLLVYPPATVAPTSRAVADNTKDVTVQVQKGTFWAMDKIQVGLPRVYTTLLEKYNEAHESIIIGGLKIDYATYGEATEVTANMTISPTGGIYIVSANNLTLTYNGTAQLDNLIIVPNTAAVKTINLQLEKQILFKKTVVCQNIVLQNKVVNNWILRNCASDSKVAFDKCIMNNLTTSRGFVMPNTSGTPEKLGYFEVSNSDIRFDIAGANTSILHSMDCSELVFNNNIVYFSGEVPENTNAFITPGHFTQFKVYNGNTRTLSKLTMNANTFVDVEANGTSGGVGLIWATTLTTLSDVSNNLYWLSYPATIFNSTGTGLDKTNLIRGTTSTSTGSGSNNYGYTGNSAVSFAICYSNKPSGLAEMETITFFNKDNSNTFNKATGVFIPEEAYKAYGAQRN